MPEQTLTTVPPTRTPGETAPEPLTPDDGRSLMARFLGVLLLLLPALIVYVLIALWPRPEGSIVCGPRGQTATVQSQEPAPSTTAAQEERKEQWAPCAAIPPFVGEFRLAADVRLLILVLLAGSLGAYVHAAQSFASYIGNRKFKKQWAWWYILRLPVGAVLALFVYFTARGGLLTGTTPSSKTDDLNIFGIMTFAALAGLFSKQVVDKMAEVFTNFFQSSQDSQRKDKLEDGNRAPTQGGAVDSEDAGTAAGGQQGAGTATDTSS
jgi:hypothetical protein